jgi:pyridoxal phosphate enzyme (YggS family)
MVIPLGIYWKSPAGIRGYRISFFLVMFGSRSSIWRRSFLVASCIFSPVSRVSGLVPQRILPVAASFCSPIVLTPSRCLSTRKSHRMEASAPLDPEARQVIVDNAAEVMNRIRSAASSSGRNPDEVRLVAVSKTKGEDYVQALYDAGFRHFGENYMQELLEKASKLPNDISWHFIGHLQSTKANKIIKELPNLSVLETLDSAKLAGKLNRACEEANRVLPVYIQVHTSNEDTKNGVTPDELEELAMLIVNDCKSLQLAGLMTSEYC